MTDEGYNKRRLELYGSGRRLFKGIVTGMPGFLAPYFVSFLSLVIWAVIKKGIRLSFNETDSFFVFPKQLLQQIFKQQRDIINTSRLRIPQRSLVIMIRNI